MNSEESSDNDTGQGDGTYTPYQELATLPERDEESESPHGFSGSRQRRSILPSSSRSASRVGAESFSSLSEKEDDVVFRYRRGARGKDSVYRDQELCREISDFYLESGGLGASGTLPLPESGFQFASFDEEDCLLREGLNEPLDTEQPSTDLFEQRNGFTTSASANTTHTLEWQETPSPLLATPPSPIPATPPSPILATPPSPVLATPPSPEMTTPPHLPSPDMTGSVLGYGFGFARRTFANLHEEDFILPPPPYTPPPSSGMPHQLPLFKKVYWDCNQPSSPVVTPGGHSALGQGDVLGKHNGSAKKSEREVIKDWFQNILKSWEKTNNLQVTSFKFTSLKRSDADLVRNGGLGVVNINRRPPTATSAKNGKSSGGHGTNGATPSAPSSLGGGTNGHITSPQRGDSVNDRRSNGGDTATESGAENGGVNGLHSRLHSFDSSNDSRQSIQKDSGNDGGSSSGVSLRTDSSSADRSTYQSDKLAILKSADIEATVKGKVKSYSVIIKVLPSDDSDRYVVKHKFRQLLKFSKEVQVYMKIIKCMYIFDEKRYNSACIEPPVPRLYFAQLDALNDCLVIENLEKDGYSKYGVRFPGQHLLSDLDHCRMALRCLAHFHAYSTIIQRDSEELLVELWPFAVEASCFRDVFMEKMIPVKDEVCQYLSHRIDPNTSQVWEQKLEKEIQELFWKLVELRVPPENERMTVLIHGSPDLANLHFSYNQYSGRPNQAKLTDLSSVSVSSPVVDIGYFLYSSVDPTLITDHYIGLLQAYHQAHLEAIKGFGMHGYEIELETLVIEYKKRIEYGAMWACLVRPALYLLQKICPRSKLSEEKTSDSDSNLELRLDKKSLPLDLKLSAHLARLSQVCPCPCSFTAAHSVTRDFVADNLEVLTNSVAAAVNGKHKYKGLDCNRGTKSVMKRILSGLATVKKEDSSEKSSLNGEGSEAGGDAKTVLKEDSKPAPPTKPDKGEKKDKQEKSGKGLKLLSAVSKS